MQQPHAARPAGGRRFLWTVFAFALANAAAWAAYVVHTRPAGPAALPPLHVQRFAPGDGQTVGPRPTFRWTFDADVGTPQPGPIALDATPGAMSPPVVGTWAWADARTLTFAPAADLPKATRFALTLRPDRLRAAGASPMAEPYVAAVRTQPLQVLNVRHVGRVDGEAILEVTFSDAVLGADVLAHVKAVGPDGKPRDVALHGEPNGPLVRLRCELRPEDEAVTDDDVATAAANAAPPAAAPAVVLPAAGPLVTQTPSLTQGPVVPHAFTLRVSAGLAGTGGPLGLERPAEFPLRLVTAMAATGAGAHCPPSGDPHIGLTFNGTPDPETVRPLLRVEPAVPFTVSRPDPSTLWLVGAFAPGTRYAVTIVPPPGGTKGGPARDGVPRPGTFSVYVGDRPSAVWLDHDEGYLGSKGNRTLMAHAVNVAAVRVTVTRVYDSNLVAWRNAADRRRWSPAVAPYARPVASRRLDVGGERNVVRDVRLSLDDLLPPAHRGDGAYRLTVVADAANPAGTAAEHVDDDASADGDDDDGWGGRGFGRRRSFYDGEGAAAVVTLSDIGLSAKLGRGGAVSAWAVSLSAGRPMDGVRVRLYSDKGQVLATATTDADGLAAMADARPAPGERAAVLIADVPTSEPATPASATPASATLTSAAPTSPAAPAAAQLTWLDLRTAETPTADADVGGAAYARAGYEAFVYADRGVYRPGETVRLRAIVRGPGQAAPAAAFPVQWRFRRPDLRDWRSEVTPLDADGSAGVDLALPADLSTGRWTAQVGLAGEPGKPHAVFGSVAFQVEEYVPERIKASVDAGGAAGEPGAAAAAGQRPARLSLAAGKTEARVQADYLFGKPAGGLAAAVVATLEPARFESPAWRGWAFGDSADVGQTLGRPSPAHRREELPLATTDARGRAAWPLDLSTLGRDTKADAAAAGDGYRGPWTLTLVGSVREDGGRAVTAARSIPVDAAPHYVALRPAETSPRARVATTVAVAVVRPTGEAEAGGASLVATLFREDWNTVLLSERGRYRYQSTRKLVPVGDPRDVACAAGRGQVELTPPQGGRYVLVVRDAAADVETSLAFYAVEPAWQDNISRENPEKVDLVLLPPLQADPARQLLGAVGAFDGGGASFGTLRAALADVTRASAEANAEANAAGVAEPSAGGRAAPVRYRVGDRARVLVRSPFAGRLLLCVETDGVLSRTVVDMPASQVVVPVDVTDACRPNAYVTATVVRAVDPDAAWRAHRAAGVVRLPLDPADRRLTVALDLPAEVRPESTLSGEVRLTDADGRPAAGAAVTVYAVDEGVLQLTNFKTPDPLAHFLSPRALGVRSADLYGLLMPEVPKAAADAATGGDTEGTVFGSAGNRRTNPVSARRVRSVALATGVLHADADGRARVELPVPAFAGRLRVMVVAYTAATEASKFGSAEAATAVRGPLLVQTSWPRFAAPGDRFAVPVTVFNNTPTAGTVKLRLTAEGDAGRPVPLAFAADGGAAGDGGAAASIDLAPLAVPANGQAATVVRVAAADTAGVARVRLVATLDVSGAAGPANVGPVADTFNESLELSVRPPSPEVTDGGFAAATAAAPAAVVPPAGLLPGTGQLRVRVTPWPTLSVPRGLDYLDRYPYGCAEQTTSTAFPLVYLGDLGERLGAAPGRFDRGRIADKVQAGILRLIGMQTADGGLAMWPGGRESWPWASVYAAHFVLEARAAGHAVPEDFQARLLGYCRSLLDRGGDEPQVVEAQAYACYALAAAGKAPRSAMSRLSEMLARPTPTDESRQIGSSTARWHLAMAWLAAGRRDLAAGMVPAVLPAPRDGRRQDGTLATALGDRATMLTAMLAVAPDRPEVAALATEVADRLSKVRFPSTHETALAVCALGRYVRTIADAPSYDGVELWAGNDRLAAATGGRPLTWEPPAGTPLPAGLQVRLSGEAATRPADAGGAAGATAAAGAATRPAARAFVAWLSAGVPMTPPPAADAGLSVRRRYLDPAGNELDPSRLASGDLVRVELTLSAPTALENVVVEDLLPAGLEVESPRLQSGWAATVAARGAGESRGAGVGPRANGAAATSSPPPPPPERPNVFQTAHTDVRDDRVVVVGRLTSGGQGAVTYLARAVAPGTYAVPPVRAECMYDGGVRSVWGGGRMTVRGADAAKPPDAGKVAGAARAE